MSNLADLERAIGYQFTDRALLTLAVTHRSYSADNNERLEFLGDAILGLTIAKNLYLRFPDVDEGVLSRYRSNLVKGKTLADVARDIHLGQYLLLGDGEKKSGGHHRESILADATEAVFGAVYLDGGEAAGRQVILDLYHHRLENLASEPVKDPKTALQEYLQKLAKPLPEYHLIDVEGEPHDQLFTVTCTVEGLPDPTDGVANSRREAEKKAAAKALSSLMGKA